MVERFDDQDRNDGGLPPENQHAFTLHAMDRVGISVGELWLHYLSTGGNIDEYEVDAYLHGLMPLPAFERDMISQSVNEMIDDITHGPRAPYSTARSNTVPGTDRSSLDTAPSKQKSGQNQVLSVVYSSSATQPFSDAELADLLTASRRKNHSSHLTGLLLYRGGRFLQVLEGPEAVVRDRMAVISVDPRHDNLRVLIDEPREQRQFPVWTMRYGTIGPAMSKYVSGFERPFSDAKDDADPDRTVHVLRNLVRWFQDPAIPLR